MLINIFAGVTTLPGAGAARLEICHGEHGGEDCRLAHCHDAPPHGYIYMSGIPWFMLTRPFFSRMAAHDAVEQAGYRDGMMDADKIRRLHAEITAEESIPFARTRADRIVSRIDPKISASYLDIYLANKGEFPEGQQARFEECKGNCGHEHCSSYPKHVLLFVDGIVDLQTPPVFSQDCAVKRMTTFVEAGAVESLAPLVESLKGVDLPQTETRFDRIASHQTWTGKAIKEAFRILTSTETPHSRERSGLWPSTSHVSQAGREISCFSIWAFGVEFKEPVFSRRTFERTVRNMLELGLLTEAEIAPLEVQFTALDLPDTHPADDLKTQFVDVVALVLGGDGGMRVFGGDDDADD